MLLAIHEPRRSSHIHGENLEKAFMSGGRRRIFLREKLVFAKVANFENKVGASLDIECFPPLFLVTTPLEEFYSLVLPSVTWVVTLTTNVCICIY